MHTIGCFYAFQNVFFCYHPVFNIVMTVILSPVLVWETYIILTCIFFSIILNHLILVGKIGASSQRG